VQTPGGEKMGPRGVPAREVAASERPRAPPERLRYRGDSLAPPGSNIRLSTGSAW
jgi:hypothetical protein